MSLHERHPQPPGRATTCEISHAASTTETCALLREIKRLQGQLVEVYNDLGVRCEFDAITAREVARMVRSRLGKEPTVVDDASQRYQAKRQETVRSIPMPVGWAEFYSVHSFHGPPLPQLDGRGKRVKSRPGS